MMKSKKELLHNIRWQEVVAVALGLPGGITYISLANKQTNQKKDWIFLIALIYNLVLVLLYF
jgi:hypothetical protein